MRHQKRGFKLGRTASHRKATLMALSTALIKHKRITTTLTKAKALRSHVEPIVNRSKEDTMHNRREVFRSLQDKEAVTELFNTIADKVQGREGGYTRIIKLGFRKGDATEMAMIELVDFNDVKPDGASSSSKRKTRRSRRSGGSSSASKPQATPTPKVEEVAEDVTEAVEIFGEEVEEAVTEANADNDLTKVEGIGPKIASVLSEGGIQTFSQLASASLEQLQNLLSDAGLASHDPSTWSKQATLAAEGKWDELKAWQDELDGGKETA